MGRKVTTGIVGTPSFGKIAFNSNTITTTTGVTQANTDLILDPAGTGRVRVSKDLLIYANSDSGAATVGELRFYNSGNTNYSAFKSGSLSADLTYTLPTAYATTNSKFLQSTTSGTLDWVDSSVRVTNDTATASAIFPLLTAATSNTTIADTYRSSTGLSFIPSSGTLISTVLQTATIQGGTANSAVLTLRSTSSGTKGYVYIEDATDATANSTGSFQTAGGIYAAKKIRTADTITCLTLTETSSITFKENVQPLTGALDSILQLSGKIYDRKDGSYKNETGLIAEEVEKIIPYVVTKDQDGNPYGINYTKLVAYLIESIKTLNTEINELKNR
jgi:hypothetical protein